MEKPIILYEDTHLIVCYKPAGFPVQTRKTAAMDLEHYLKNHLLREMRKSGNKSQKPPYLAVIHRLDQPVSGILVFAKTPSAAQKLNLQMQNGGFTKEYEAVLCGIPPKESDTLEDYLVKDGSTNTSSICQKDTPGAKRCELSYQVLESDPAKSRAIVRIQLKTGRHHQIRVQMAGLGTPLWGDNRYNPAFRDRREYQPIALCACHLSLTHPETGELLTYKIPCNWAAAVRNKNFSH